MIRSVFEPWSRFGPSLSQTLEPEGWARWPDPPCPGWSSPWSPESSERHRDQSRLMRRRLYRRPRIGRSWGWSPLSSTRRRRGRGRRSSRCPRPRRRWSSFRGPMQDRWSPDKPFSLKNLILQFRFLFWFSELYVFVVKYYGEGWGRSELGKMN